MINKYYTYNCLTDKEKGNIINEVIKLSHKTIKLYKDKLDFSIHEEFFSDVLYGIVEIFSLQVFKFSFYKSKEELFISINSNSRLKQYYKRFVKEKYDIIIEDYIYSKEFVYQYFEEYRSYTFLCKFKSYINVAIKNIYSSFIQNKNNKIVYLDDINKVFNNHLIVDGNFNLAVNMLYLSKEEKKLITLFTKTNKNKVIKKLKCSNQTLNKKLKVIKDKICN